ncbi:MAG: DUF4388 domain-containing protein [Polyangiaceae bacterium]|nr:DUF4388 domain-containing protein [Polyangiaceae bacterium]
MSAVVLLVHPDVDALGRIAEALRGRGLTVIVAQDLAQAGERVRARRPTIVLLARALAASPALERAPDVLALPRLVLSSGDPAGDEIAEHDTDRLAAEAHAAAPSAPPVEASEELRGNLAQAPIVDVLQLLMMNRRSGVLEVRTPMGRGELRMADGEVQDAAHRRLDGEKAFYRMLAERDGTFVFHPGPTSGPARFTRGTAALLMEAMQHKDEVARHVDELGLYSTFVADTPPDAPPGDRAAADLLASLSSPRTLGELLDELPSPDLEVLTTLRALMEAGLARRAATVSAGASIAPPDHLPVLRALTERLRREGFDGPPRVAMSGPPSRLAVLGQALLRVSSAASPHAGPPPAGVPAPHDLATLKIGDGELAVLAVPDVEAMAPLLGLALPSVHVVVHLDPAPSPWLQAAITALELRSLSALELVPGFDEGDPAQVTRLVRAVIELGGAA